MVDIRVEVEDTTRVPALVGRLRDLREVVDLVRSITEKKSSVESEWESRRVRGVLDVVQTWLTEDGAESATLSIGDSSYSLRTRPSSGEPMIGLAPNGVKTLEAVRRISIAGRGAPTSSALLENVCAAVAETFEFDSVAAVMCDGQAEEVRKTLGLSVFLLAEAQETQRLAVLTARDLTYALRAPPDEREPMSRAALRDAQSKDVGRGYRQAGARDRRGCSRDLARGRIGPRGGAEAGRPRERVPRARHARAPKPVGEHLRDRSHVGRTGARAGRAAARRSPERASGAGGADPGSGRTAARPFPARFGGDRDLARARSTPTADRGGGSLAHRGLGCGDGRGPGGTGGGGGSGGARSDALEPARELDAPRQAPGHRQRSRWRPSSPPGGRGPRRRRSAGIRPSPVRPVRAQ